MIFHSPLEEEIRGTPLPHSCTPRTSLAPKKENTLTQHLSVCLACSERAKKNSPHILSPFVRQDGALDLRYIDPQFVKESVSDMAEDVSVDVDVQIDDTFAGFTYTTSYLDSVFPESKSTSTSEAAGDGEKRNAPSPL